MRSVSRSIDAGGYPHRAPGLVLVAVVVLALLKLCHGHRAPILDPSGNGGATTISSSGHVASCTTPAATAAVPAPGVLTGDADGPASESATALGLPGLLLARHCDSAEYTTATAPHGWTLLIMLSVFRN